jgi:hypothetical protein
MSHFSNDRPIFAWAPSLALGGVPASQGLVLDPTIFSPSRFEPPAQSERGSQQFPSTSQHNGKPSSPSALELSPGANRLGTEAAVKALLEFDLMTATAVLLFGRPPVSLLQDEGQALLLGKVTMPSGVTAKRS